MSFSQTFSSNLSLIFPKLFEKSINSKKKHYNILFVDNSLNISIIYKHLDRGFITGYKFIH